MLTISPKALAHVLGKGGVIYLEPTPRVAACCASVQEAPSPRLGRPPNEGSYRREEIQGVTCYLPRSLPEDREVKLTLRGLFGLRWLELDGWSVL